MSTDASKSGGSGGSSSGGNGHPAFPFVVGCQRSGTTLVRAMLASHPAVATPPESPFLLSLVPDDHRPFDPSRLAEALGEQAAWARWRIPRRVIEASFRDDPPANHADAMRRLYRLWSDGKGRERYADKTPEHVLRIGALAALFPEARFVHVVRDGRDVAASLLELGWVDSVEKAALHWRHRVRRGRQAAAGLPQLRYHELRYEDLVQRPEVTVQALCAALDLSYEPAMLRYEAAAAEVQRTEPHPHHNRYVTRPLRPALRDWRRDMPDAAVHRFEVLAGDVLAELGYDLRSRSQRPALRDRVAARADWLAWHGRKLRKSGRDALEGGDR